MKVHALFIFTAHSFLCQNVTYLSLCGKRVLKYSPIGNSRWTLSEMKKLADGEKCVHFNILRLNYANTDNTLWTIFISDSLTDIITWSDKVTSDCLYGCCFNESLARCYRIAGKHKTRLLCFRKHTTAPLTEGKVKFGKLKYIYISAVHTFHPVCSYCHVS